MYQIFNAARVPGTRLFGFENARKSELYCLLVSDFQLGDLRGGGDALDGCFVTTDERCPRRPLTTAAADADHVFIVRLTTALTMSVPDRHSFTIDY